MEDQRRRPHLGEEGPDVDVAEGILCATIRILNPEDGLDQLLFRGFGGDDTVDALDLSGIELFVQGGDGDDVIIGSAFGDTLSGDDGADVIVAGGGNDHVFGNAGDDVVDGGADLDTLNGGPGDDVLLNGEFVSDPDGNGLLF